MRPITKIMWEKIWSMENCRQQFSKQHYSAMCTKIRRPFRFFTYLCSQHSVLQIKDRLNLDLPQRPMHPILFCIHTLFCINLSNNFRFFVKNIAHILFPINIVLILCEKYLWDHKNNSFEHWEVRSNFETECYIYSFKFLRSNT